jgi:hypothetical protein
LRGGFAGTQRLEPVDTDDPRLGIRGNLIEILESTDIKRFADTLTGGAAATADVPETGRTEQMVYQLTVTGSDGRETTYELPQKAVDDCPGLAQLLKSVWAAAKPVPQD